jgi:hypothetical protein
VYLLLQVPCLLFQRTDESYAQYSQPYEALSKLQRPHEVRIE